MHHITARRRMMSMIESGHTPVGAYVQLLDPAVTALLGAAGYDFVVIDREHAPNDIQSTLAHVRAAEANDLVPIVRVLRNDPAEIQSTLDIGAEGIIIPKVSSRADAERALAASRYQPGGRGMCPAVEAARWTRDWPTYRDEANANVIIIPLIETVSGLENLKDIASVDGIDFVEFGFADMSQDMGIDYSDHKRLDAMWADCVKVLVEAGVQPGCNLGRGSKAGATWGTLNSDTRLLLEAAGLALARSGLHSVQTPVGAWGDTR